MSEKLVTLLAIGGMDPMGGAGLEADIRAASHLGLHTLTAVTAVTVQNSKGMKAINAVAPEILSQQLSAILDEVMPDVVKIGLPGSFDNAKVIAEFLRQLPPEMPVVVDPVFYASAGGQEISDIESLLFLYQNSIFPFATVVTPNLKEAKQFLKFNSIFKFAEPRDVGMALMKIWNCNAIILKGGHSEGEEITDLLIDNFQNSLIFAEVKHKKENCKNLHGTGCVYASLLACYLALGFPLHEAFRKASNSIHEIITRSGNYSLGNSLYGPLNINSYRL